jgi:hypothetical protein
MAERQFSVDEHELMASLRREARARGAAWTRSIAERRPELLTQPFPPNVGRTRQLARRKVVDLHADAIVVDELEGELCAAALDAWSAS